MWERRIDVYGRWQIRSLRCYEEGLELRGIDLKAERHPLAADPSRALLMEFLAAAVCHRTNWDRLRRFLIEAANDPHRFTPTRLAALSEEDFSTEFADAFDDTKDISGRYGIFTAVAASFSFREEIDSAEMLSSKTQTLGGSSGIYASLDRIAPFRADPQRKKARILVQQLIRSGLITVSDPNEMRPAIEYHLIRLYLRTGRVAHADAYEFRRHDDRATDLRSVTALRLAVEQAMHYSAAAAGLTIPEINEAEWQIARSFCVREAPRCDGPPRPDKPVDQEIKRVGGGACPFAETCNAPQYPSIAALTEPRLAAHHEFY